MMVTMVSNNCLLVELSPICHSMAASLCLKSCEDSSYLKSIMEVYGKTMTGLGPVELFNSYITGEIMA